MPGGKRWSPAQSRRPILVNKPQLIFPSDMTAKIIGRSVSAAHAVSDETIRLELEAAYLKVGRGLYRRPLMTLGNQLRLASAWVQRHGVSPKGVVAFLCTKLAQLNKGKFPLPNIVFSQKTLNGFLPAYRRNETCFIEVASLRPSPLVSAQKVEWAKRKEEHRISLELAYVARGNELSRRKLAAAHIAPLSPEQTERRALEAELRAVEARIAEVRAQFKFVEGMSNV